MTDRRDFLSQLAALGIGAQLPNDIARVAPADDRRYWVDVLSRVARPVLTNLADGRLKARMPVETSPGGNVADRRNYTYL